MKLIKKHGDYTLGDLFVIPAYRLGAAPDASPDYDYCCVYFKIPATGANGAKVTFRCGGEATIDVVLWRNGEQLPAVPKQSVIGVREFMIPTDFPANKLREGDRLEPRVYSEPRPYVLWIEVDPVTLHQLTIRSLEAETKEEERLAFWVDGRPTGVTTPATLTLPEGRHTVTVSNRRGRGTKRWEER